MYAFSAYGDALEYLYPGEVPDVLYLPIGIRSDFVDFYGREEERARLRAEGLQGRELTVLSRSNA